MLDFAPFLRIGTSEGWFTAQPQERNRVIAAIRLYRERGIDTVLEILDRHGDPVVLVASVIHAIWDVTPEIRMRAELEDLREEEFVRDFRKEHAAPEWSS